MVPSELTVKLGDLDLEGVLADVQRLIDSGAAPLDVLKDLQEGMLIVGRRFEAEDYFLSELIYSAEIFKQATALFGDTLQKDSGNTIGTFVLGTVAGDIHDFGKDIVAMVLSSNGFKVVDLGVNVPADDFVKAIREHQPEVVGMSCLLTTCFESMKATVDAIAAAGLRDKVKIIVGGGPVDQMACDYAGADAYGTDAQNAVDRAKALMAVS